MGSLNEAAASLELRQLERRAKRFWIALVVFLFLVQGTIMGLVMHLAIGDPSAAVIPDYHNAALNWDETRRTHLAAERLGWEVTLQASEVADQRGRRAIELKITGGQGEGIEGLEVAGKLYHHARANDVHPVQLDSVGRGRYLTLAPAARPGLWQLELEIGGAAEPVAQSITFRVPES